LSDDGRSGTLAAVLPRPHLDASALLALWEEGAGQPPARRAVLLLSAAWPGSPYDPPYDPWLDVSIGRRDAWLLTLREELFGHRLEVVAPCPACEAPLEVALSTGDVRVPAGVDAGGDVVAVEAHGYRVEGRPPTSADLIDVVDQASENGWADDSTAPTELLRRCITLARQGDTDVDAAALPASVREAVALAMAEADPQADMRLTLGCPECDHRWSSPFDILSYLWDEIDDWAGRILREVHALASAYGWSERDILGMSARRRRLYLELCGGWA
jgi:hypothetical protein